MALAPEHPIGVIRWRAVQVIEQFERSKWIGRFLSVIVKATHLSEFAPEYVLAFIHSNSIVGRQAWAGHRNVARIGRAMVFLGSRLF